MKYWLPAVFALTVVLLSACAVVSSSDLSKSIAAETYAIPEGAIIAIKIDSGIINVTAGERGELGLSGNTAASAQGSYTVTHAAGEVRVNAQAGGHSWLDESARRFQLNLRVPPSSTVRIDTFDAEVNVRAYQGAVDITSMAGNILAENVNGTAVLRSNRGAITVRKSAGEIDLLGNYGLLSLEEVSGQVSASTIMGTIRFAGAVSAVGNVCGIHFGLDGQETCLDFCERLVSIRKPDLFAIPVRLGVAGGPGKVEPIVGALRGGYINILVTDGITARRVLDLADKD